MVGCVISDIVRAPAFLMCQMRLQLFTLLWTVRSLATEDIRERKDSVGGVGCV